MLNAHVQYDDDLDLTIVEVKERVSPEELSIFLKDVFDDNPRAHAIWDISPDVLKDLQYDKFRSVTQGRLDRWRKFDEGQLFFVVHGVSEELMMRWWEKYVQHFDEFPFDVHIRRSIDRAVADLRAILEKAKA